MIDMYLSPSSILGFSVNEYNQRFSSNDLMKKLVIYTNLLNGSYTGSASNKTFEFNYNITKDGFRVNKEVNYIVEHIKTAIKSPLTCGFVIKLTCDELHPGNLKISFE
jgi:hypothetical protein